MGKCFEKVVFNYGQGQDGKSTVSNLIKNACKEKASAFHLNDGDKFAMSNFIGKTVLIDNDFDANQDLNLEVLKQKQYSPMAVEKQIIILYAAVNDYLSDIKVEDVRKFEEDFLEYMDTQHREVGKEILAKKVLSDEIKKELEEAITEFKKIFLK